MKEDQASRAVARTAPESRISRRKAYATALAAGIAAIAVCVASYLADLSRHTDDPSASQHGDTAAQPR
jgi:hypothetical protein